MVLMRDLRNFSFFGRGDVSPTHSELCRFVSGSLAKRRFSSSVIIVLKKIICFGHHDNVLVRYDSIFPLLRCQGVWIKTCTQLSLSQILFQNSKNYSLGDVQRFCHHFLPFQQQQQCLPQFESISDGHLSRHLLPPPSVSKSRIPPKNIWSVHSLIPITLLHQY